MISSISYSQVGIRTANPLGTPIQMEKIITQIQNNFIN